MSESHDDDLWESARGSQKEEVAAIWAARGAPPERPPKEKWRPWKALAVIVAALAVVALVVVILSGDGAEDRREADAAQARLEAQERARLLAEGKPIFVDGPPKEAGEAPLAYRARLVIAGEAAITADARRRAETGEIDRDIKGTLCRTFPFTPTREAQERDTGLAVNRYQCTAFNSRFKLSELEGEQRTAIIGQPYWLVADYRTGALTLCKQTPKPGEGGKALATVPVDPACRDPLS